LRVFLKRLTVLAPRPGPLVADLIKASEALSQVQFQIDVAEGYRRGRRERVDTGRFTVHPSAAKPLRRRIRPA